MVYFKKNILIKQIRIYFNLSSQPCRMKEKIHAQRRCFMGSEAGGVGALASLWTLKTMYLAQTVVCILG